MRGKYKERGLSLRCFLFVLSFTRNERGLLFLVVHSGKSGISSIQRVTLGPISALVCFFYFMLKIICLYFRQIITIIRCRKNRRDEGKIIETTSAKHKIEFSQNRVKHKYSSIEVNFIRRSTLLQGILWPILVSFFV